MTSDDTDGRTRELLAAHDNFGMEEGQVVLLKQGKVPSIMDNDGRIALDDSGYRVQTKCVTAHRLCTAHCGHAQDD